MPKTNIIMETEQIRSLEEQRANIDWVSSWMLDVLKKDKDNVYDRLAELEALILLNDTKCQLERLIEGVK